MVSVITEGVNWVGSRVGATKVRVAPVPGGLGPCVTSRPIRAGAPDWLTVKVSGSDGGMLGSDPLRAMTGLACPEKSEMGATGLTTGTAAGMIVTVVETGTDVKAAVLVAVTVTVMLVGVVTPAGAV
jgi:hypothetical protein